MNCKHDFHPIMFNVCQPVHGVGDYQHSGWYNSQNATPNCSFNRMVVVCTHVNYGENKYTSVSQYYDQAINE